MLFSIVVPIYNVEQFLQRCLESIASQDFDDYEVILVDDGSTDNCPFIADNFVQSHPKFSVIHQKNKGLVGARNTGLFAAKGEYITYLDSDDWASPKMLSEVYKMICSSPVRPDVIMFAAEEIWKDRRGETRNNVPEGFYDRERLEKEIFPYLFSDRRRGFNANTQLFAHTWDKFFKREIQIEHYCREERIRMFTDVPLTFESLLYCSGAYICNDHLYFYNRMNENSIRTKGKSQYITENFVILNRYLRERLGGYSEEIRRQLNDYPAVLINGEIIGMKKEGLSAVQAARRIRKELDETGFLDLIDANGLPMKQKLLIYMLRFHLEYAVMLYARFKNFKERPGLNYEF